MRVSDRYCQKNGREGKGREGGKEREIERQRQTNQIITPTGIIESVLGTNTHDADAGKLFSSLCRDKMEPMRQSCDVWRISVPARRIAALFEKKIRFFIDATDTKIRGNEVSRDPSKDAAHLVTLDPSKLRHGNRANGKANQAESKPTRGWQNRRCSHHGNFISVIPLRRPSAMHPVTKNNFNYAKVLTKSISS